MMTPAMHIGKLSQEISTTVTDEFSELLKDRARAANCKPSDLIREGMYLLLTGDSYSGHVAKDMSAAFHCPLPKQAEMSGSSGAKK